MTKAARGLIEGSFKELLKTKTYNKITVTEICEHSGVSRKAFYANYSDKEAIIASLFDRHIMEPIRETRRFLSYEMRYTIADKFSLQMYESLYAEREYYTNLVCPIRGNDDTFLRVVTWAIYDFNIGHIPQLAKPMPEWQLDYTAYFFASSQAMWMQKWISEKMLIPPKDLAELYSKITSPFWEELIKVQ